MPLQLTKKSLVLFLLSLTLAGCANQLDANITPGATLRQQQTFFVQKHDKDSNGVAELIAKQLVAMNYRASVGPVGAKIPSNTDIVVTYTDKWMWDFTMYLFELNIIFREPSTDFPIAKGSALHGSLTRRSPAEMVDEVITEIFKQAHG
jgi:hypothetical protein